MRNPSILKVARKRGASKTFTVPAPVGGLNARDSVATMDPHYANIMQNWWPTTNDIMVRKGANDHVTGLSGQVESLMPYVKPDGTEALFAAEGTDFFDATTAGAVGAAVVSGVSNARWDSINFTNTSGVSYLCCFNGADTPKYWNNSAWISITGASSPAITGVTTTTLKAPWVHQRRMWMIEKDSLKAWFLPVDAVGGAAEALDLSGICKLGGHLIAGGNYTFDGGDGPDDYWYAITSEGEAVAYRGTDPTSLSTWSLVGVWSVGRPIGSRPLLKFRGEALLILEEGVYPLAQALQSAGVTSALTFTIKDSIANASALYSSNFGWELAFYQEANMLILNVPRTEGSDQQQYAMNIITGAWTVFDNIDANCWTIFKGQPYFGGNQTVGQLWGNFTDNGNNIDTELQQAFSDFGLPGMIKHVKLVKPFIFSDGKPKVLIGCNSDFKDETPSSSLTFAGTAYGVWDTAVWDSGVWGGALNINDDWQTVFAEGEYSALRMQTASNGLEVRLKASNYVFEAGGIVG